MKIPAHYQIFEKSVTLTDKDCDRLRPHLASWPKLNEIFLMGVNEPDLQRFIIIELMFFKRRDMLARLLGRLGKLRQEALRGKIEGALAL